MAADLAWMDGGEPITVTLYRPEGTQQVSIAQALKRRVDRPNRAFNGVVVEGAEVVWHLPASALGEATLRSGDVIATAPAGDTPVEQWVVLEVAVTTLNSRLEASCRKLAGS